MIETPSLALAFTAGLVSFVSPCCLPLVPGYLAAVSDSRPDQLRTGFSPRVLSRSAVFVATFSLIFILLGLGATAIGSFLFDRQRTLTTVAGIAVIAMGSLIVVSVFVPQANREWRPTALMERAGSGGPVVAGAAFAVAWTPCIGPTLGAILGLASTSAGTAQAGLLLAVYSAGLAVPFLGTAVAFTRASASFQFFKRHYAVIQLAAGLVLIAMGVLVLTGELVRLNIEAQRLLDQLGLNFFRSI